MELFATISVTSHLVTVLRQRKKVSVKGLQFIPFKHEDLPEGTLVVDCTHRSARQLTHHLKGETQKQLMDPSVRGDTSTDCVLNALKRRATIFSGLKYVTTSHFDVDSFTSVWSCMYPSIALKYEKIVREIASIGDFRELCLNEPWQHDALKLTCWLNSEERRLFYRPFEKKITMEGGEVDGMSKFEHFLPLFEEVLRDPERFKEQWTVEYEKAVKDYATVAAAKKSQYPELGLVSIKLVEPVHYYALFSASFGYDIVLSMYRGNRYEVEMKYTTMIDITSRPTLPRVEMGALAQYLNELEAKKRAAREKTALAVTITDKYYWHCDRIVDSGPILRLESKTKNLRKAERYVHPYERPIYPSLIDPSEMEQILLSYLSYAYANVNPKKDHEWAELHDFNNNIKWSAWKPPLKDVHEAKK